MVGLFFNRTYVANPFSSAGPQILQAFIPLISVYVNPCSDKEEDCLFGF